MRTSDPEQDAFLQIEHDIHQQVVYNLTDYILTSLFSNGYRAVTVGECLGDPVANWYRNGPAGSVIVPTSRTNPITTSSTRTSVSIRTTVSSRTSISTRTTVPFPTTRTTAQPTIRTTAQPTTRSVIQITPTIIVDPTRSVITTRPASTRGPSTDGSCGNGITCSGTRYGACCSPFGYCGTGSDYCSLENGCQASWGYCEGSGSPPAAVTSGKLPLFLFLFPPFSKAQSKTYARYPFLTLPCVLPGYSGDCKLINRFLPGQHRHHQPRGLLLAGTAAADH